MAARRAHDAWASKEDGAPLLGVILWTVARLRPALRAFGLDPRCFRELLRVRVLLALRPASGTSAWGVAGLALAVVMTWFAGVGTGLLALMVEDPGAWIVLSQSAQALLVALLLFQYLAGILVDPTDIGVVAPHPVDERTLFAVRLAEIFAYLLVFVASFAAGNMLLAVFGQPPLLVLFVYPLLALLGGVTTLGALALLFALCLRLVGPTHFQRVTLWAQILGGVLIFLALQVPRLVHREQWGLWLEQYGALRHLWPPFLYAELFALLGGQGGRAQLWPSAVALLLPLAALWVTFHLASRYFVAGLQGTLGAALAPGGWPRGWLTGLGRRLAPGKERAGFDYATALARREPHYLRAVVPQLAMFQVMALGSGLRGELAFYLPLSAAFLFLLLPNVLMQAQGTPTPEARTLFASAPLEDESVLLRGAVKGLLLQWIGGPALLLALVQLLVVGREGLPRILLAFELAFLAVLFFAPRYELGLPFTQAIRVGENSAANFGLLLVSGFALVVLGGLHALLAMHPLALGAGILGAGAGLVILWGRLGRLRVAAAKRARAPHVPVAHG